MCAKECIGSFGELARGDVSSPEAAFDRADRRLEIVASHRRKKDARTRILMLLRYLVLSLDNFSI